MYIFYHKLRQVKYEMGLLLYEWGWKTNALKEEYKKSLTFESSESLSSSEDLLCNCGTSVLIDRPLLNCVLSGSTKSG